MKPAILFGLMVGSTVLCGCFKVITPDRVYFEGTDSLNVKIIHTQRNDQLEKEYQREAEMLREQLQGMTEAQDSLRLEVSRLESRLKIIWTADSLLRAERDDYQSKFVLYQALLNECRGSK